MKTNYCSTTLNLKVLFVVVAMGSLLAHTQPARAFQNDVTCNQMGNLFDNCLTSNGDIVSGSDREGCLAAINSVFGVIVGATGEIANLLCFVGDRRCACLRNATDNERPAWDRLLAGLDAILPSCVGRPSGNRNLTGMAQQATATACP